MQRVTVDRSLLLDGQIAGRDNVLLDGYGCRCVLGFYAQQALLLPDGALKHRGVLSEPFFGAAREMPEASWLATGLEETIAQTNDDPKIDHRTRERRLKALFKAGDIDLRYVGRRKRVD